MPGLAAECLRRPDETWPEWVVLLREHGISDYSIFLDDETLTLYAVQNVDESNSRAELPRHPEMRRWWDCMADSMATNPDHSPVVTDLRQVFLSRGKCSHDSSLIAHRP